MSWIYGKTEQNILSRGFITFFHYGPFFFVIRIVRKWNYWKSLVLQRWGDHRLRPGRDENTVDRAEGTFEKIPYQQFPNFFLISSGFLITRKKRPAVRDRYYGMETKTENPLKLFFASSKYYAANTPSAFPNRVSRNDLLIDRALTIPF